MEDWNKPDLSSYEVDVLDELKNRDVSLARMFKGTTDSNIPVDSIRLEWSGLVGTLGKWNGTTWDTLTLSQNSLPSTSSSVKGIAKVATNAEIIARTSTDTIVPPSGLASARVATADKLTNARTIGGVSFNGSADIDLPGVNIAGTQDTSGNAASATVSNENRASISNLLDTGVTSNAHLCQVNSSYISQASGVRSQVNASQGCHATSYNTQVNASYNSTSSGQRSQVNASLSCTASGDNSQVNSSVDNCVSSGVNSQINSSNLSQSSGDYSQMNSSKISNSGGDYSQINSGYSCQSTGDYSQNNCSFSSDSYGEGSQVNSSEGCNAIGARSQINASAGVDLSTAFSSAWGYGTSASTANQKIRLESQTGIGRFKGSTTTGGFDYAEYFPNLTLGLIPDGTIVTLVDEKITPAQAGDFILGTVSATAGVIGNAPEFCWSGRFIKDEFGRELKEEADFVRWKSEGDFYDGLVSECDKPIPSGATYYKQEIPITNPDYTDISSDYVPRGDRKDEWSIVGLMGQVYVRVYENIEHNTYVSAGGKQSESETRLYCMKMTTPYSSEKGYGVAFCLLR